MATQDDYIRTALRVPRDLHAQIHEAAKSNTRTFNAEIIDRLASSFSKYLASNSPSAIIDDLATQVFQLKIQLLANQWIARMALLKVNEDLPRETELIEALERLQEENKPFLKSLEEFELEELFGMKGTGWQKTAKQLIKASAGKPKRGTD